MDVLLSSAYLAPVQYYAKLLQSAGGIAYIEACDSYIKQTYRNRCMIVDANGPLALTIPTEKSEEGHCLMRDIRISEHGNWRHRHWNALEAAYRHTPFFLYYEDDFRPFYEEKIESLYEFNLVIVLPEYILKYNSEQSLYFNAALFIEYTILKVIFSL